MNAEIILSLVSDLYAQLVTLQKQIDELRQENSELRVHPE